MLALISYLYVKKLNNPTLIKFDKIFKVENYNRRSTKFPLLFITSDHSKTVFNYHILNPVFVSENNSHLKATINSVIKYFAIFQAWAFTKIIPIPLFKNIFWDPIQCTTPFNILYNLEINYLVDFINFTYIIHFKGRKAPEFYLSYILLE